MQCYYSSWADHHRVVLIVSFTNRIHPCTFTSISLDFWTSFSSYLLLFDFPERLSILVSSLIDLYSFQFLLSCKVALKIIRFLPLFSISKSSSVLDSCLYIYILPDPELKLTGDQSLYNSLQLNNIVHRSYFIKQRMKTLRRKFC